MHQVRRKTTIWQLLVRGWRDLLVDSNKIIHVIESIYEASFEPGIWPKTLKSVADLFNFNGADYYLIHDNNIKFGTVYGISTDYHEDYLKYYFSHSKRPSIASEIDEGSVVTDLDFISKNEIATNPYYQEFLKGADTEHCLFSAPLQDGELRSLFAVHAPIKHGPPSGEQRRVARVLMPHLRRAGIMQWHLSGQMRDSVRDMVERFPFGVALFDRQGRVVVINRAAERLLTPEAGLTYARRELVATDPAKGRELTKLLGEVCRPVRLTAEGKSLTFDDASRRPTLTLSLAPLPRDLFGGQRVSAVAIIQSRKGPDDLSLEQRIAGALKLTPAEARLAAAFFGNTSIRRTAEELRLTENTVRQTMKKIFEKCDVHSQAALVKLIYAVALSVPNDQHSLPHLR